MAIRPTFFGMELARSALSASQRNTDVTGQNIANMTTDGYSRQRLNLAAIGAGNLNYRYSLAPADKVGMGVDMTGIQRMRDQFLDVRYWRENCDNSRYAVKTDTLGSVEMYLDEFTTGNVHAVLNDFNEALQELSLNSDEAEFASNIQMLAISMTRTLNKAALDIENVRLDQIAQLSLLKDNINHIAKSIDDVNREIISQSTLGIVANELLDRRDLLIDELSSYGNVRVVAEPDPADYPYIEDYEGPPGGVSVYFGVEDIYGDTCLVDGTKGERIERTDDGGYYNTLNFDPEDSEYYPEDSGSPYRLTWATGNNEGNDVAFNSGAVFAYYEMLNGIGDIGEENERIDIASKGIPYFSTMLDSFASTLARVFNETNDSGMSDTSLFESTDSEDIKAYNIKISDEWKENPLSILRGNADYAPDPDDEDSVLNADNENILKMIYALKREDIDFGDGFVGSLHQYVNSINSEIMLEVNYTTKQLDTSDSILLTVANFRDSVMSVSEDEEAMNLMRFQKSYTAAARLMTALDEMIDTIVNRLGIVGR